MVATKWLPILKPARDLRRNIDERIECLAPYPVDLYQVHIPWSRSPVAAQMREMAALVRAGKVRAVGVSNFSAKRMAQAGAALQAEGLPARLQPGAHQPARARASRRTASSTWPASTASPSSPTRRSRRASSPAGSTTTLRG